MEPTQPAAGHVRPSARPMDGPAPRRSFDIAPRPSAGHRQMDVAAGPPRQPAPQPHPAPAPQHHRPVHHSSAGQHPHAATRPVAGPLQQSHSSIDNSPAFSAQQNPLFGSATATKVPRKTNKKIRVLVVVFVILAALLALGIFWVVTQLFDTKTVIT